MVFLMWSSFHNNFDLHLQILVITVIKHMIRIEMVTVVKIVVSCLLKVSLSVKKGTLGSNGTAVVLKFV